MVLSGRLFAAAAAAPAAFLLFDFLRGDIEAALAERDDQLIGGLANVTSEELEAQAGEELPDREAMSLVNPNAAEPVNAAVALNALSDGSLAYANAEQTADIEQSIELLRRRL